MNESQIHQQIHQYANSLLEYLKLSSKNIEWTMKVKISGWDCQIEFEGSYLDCQALVYSPSIFIGNIKEGEKFLPDEFGAYVLHTIIYDLAKRLFEA